MPGEVVQIVQRVVHDQGAARRGHNPQAVGQILFGEAVLEDQLPFAVRELERER